MLIRRHLAFPLLLVLLLAAAGCGPETAADGPPRSQSYFIFDTLVTVKVFDGEATPEQFREIEALLGTIDRQMNRLKDESEIAEVNRQSGLAAVPVSEDTFQVVKTAIDYAASSGGKFDPTVGPLVDLWRIGQGGAKRPAQAAIDEALGRVGFEAVELDEARRTIRLAKPGMSLDLGAIAKGFAADRVAAYLRQEGFRSALIDLGGNILAMGRKPGDQLWSIGVQNPNEPRGAHIGIIQVDNETIVTSGIYERYFIENGEHYHHILDPDLGSPVHNGLLGVTIVTGRSIDADAMSTAVFVLGLEEGLRYIEARPGTDVLLITGDKKVYATSGLRGRLELTNREFTLAEYAGGGR